MYFAGKITFVKLQVSNLKLQHTSEGIVWHVVRKRNYTPGIISRFL